jgi:hypothetical protein
MCPMCVTTTACVVAGTTAGAGIFGFLAGKFRALRRRRERSFS